MNLFFFRKNIYIPSTLILKLKVETTHDLNSRVTVSRITNNIFLQQEITINIYKQLEKKNQRKETNKLLFTNIIHNSNLKYLL